MAPLHPGPWREGFRRLSPPSQSGAGTPKDSSGDDVAQVTVGALAQKPTSLTWATHSQEIAHVSGCTGVACMPRVSATRLGEEPWQQIKRTMCAWSEHASEAQHPHVIALRSPPEVPYSL